MKLQTQNDVASKIAGGGGIALQDTEFGPIGEVANETLDAAQGRIAPDSDLLGPVEKSVSLAPKIHRLKKFYSVYTSHYTPIPIRLVEALLDEIVERQFGGNLSKLNTEEFLGAQYSGPDGKEVRGGYSIIDLYYNVLKKTGKIPHKTRSISEVTALFKKSYRNRHEEKSREPVEKTEITLKALKPYEKMAASLVHGKLPVDEWFASKGLKDCNGKKTLPDRLAKKLEKSFDTWWLKSYDCLYQAVSDALVKLVPSENGPVTTASFPGYSFRDPSGKTVFHSFGALLTEAAQIYTEVNYALSVKSYRLFGGEAPQRKVTTPIGLLEAIFFEAGPPELYKVDDSRKKHLERQKEYHYHLPALDNMPAMQGTGGYARTLEISRAAIAELCNQVWGYLPDKVSELTKLEGVKCISSDGKRKINALELFEAFFLDMPIESKAVKAAWENLRESIRSEQSTILSNIPFKREDDLVKSRIVIPTLSKEFPLSEPDLIKALGDLLIHVYGDRFPPYNRDLKEIDSVLCVSPEGDKQVTGRELIALYYRNFCPNENYSSVRKSWIYLRRRLKEDSALRVKAVSAPDVTPSPDGLFTGLSESPGLLFQALTIFGWEKDRRESYKAFQGKLKDGAETRVRPEGESTKAKENEIIPPLHLYSKALTQALIAKNKIDISEVGIQAHVDLLTDLCLHQFEGDIDKLVRELRTPLTQLMPGLTPQIHTQVESVLSAVLPRVASVFEQSKEFLTPSSVKTKPLPHQILAAVEAIYHGKRINAHQTGLGKTLSALIVCEHKQFERVLWVTGAANRDDVESEIQKNLTLKEGAVKTIPSDVVTNWTVEQLQGYLEGAKYVVCAYQTLRAANDSRTGNKEIYELLCKWCGTSGGLVVDEAHEFDNPISNRSAALGGVVANWRYLLTASVYQHSSKRSATLIKMVDPEKYPNIFDLEDLCRDRETAKLLIGRYASVAFCDTVAGHFEPEAKTPFAKQLQSGRALMPRAVENPLTEIPLPLERALSYVDIASSYRAWLEITGRMTPNDFKKSGASLRQLYFMRQVLFNPEVLGFGPALEVLNGIKEKALPTMQAGKKVLIFCQHRAIIDLIASDPELKCHGLVRLDGKVSTKERAQLRRQLEEEAGTLCGVAQFQASGTGSNFRSVSHVIYVQLPTLFCMYLQSRGRALRLLGPEDQRFAKEEVRFDYLAHVLPKEALERIESPKLRRLFENGTLTQRAYARLKEKLVDFEYLMRKKKGSSENGTSDSFAYLKGIIRAAQESRRKNRTLSLISNASKAKSKTLVNYDNPIKEQKHRVPQGDFTLRHAGVLDVEHGKVLALVGPQTLELSVFDRVGFKRHNIVAVEGGKRLERAVFHSNIKDSGCRYYITRLERLVRFLEDEFSFVSIDDDGYIMPADVEPYRRVRIADRAIIAKNSLAMREKGAAKDLLNEVLPGGTEFEKRRSLDWALLKLIGTAQNHPLGDMEGGEALRLHSLVRYTSRVWSEKIAPLLGGEVTPREVSQYLSDIYLGSPIVEDSEPLAYTSSSGSALRGFFALVKRPDQELRENPEAMYAREIILHGVKNSLQPGERRVVDQDYDFWREGREIVTKYNGEEIDRVTASNLVRRILDYASLCRNEPNFMRAVPFLGQATSSQNRPKAQKRSLQAV